MSSGRQWEVEELAFDTQPRWKKFSIEKRYITRFFHWIKNVRRWQWRKIPSQERSSSGKEKKSFSSRLKGKIRGQILQLPSAFSFLLEPLSVLFLLFSDVVTVLWNCFCDGKIGPLAFLKTFFFLASIFLLQFKTTVKRALQVLSATDKSKVTS